MYILVGLVITVFAFLELVNKRFRKSNVIFYLLAILLTCILCFRYGQGTDYIEYQLQFEIIDITAETLVNQLEHGEIGWFLIMLGFKKIGFSFDWFIIVLSLVMMFFTIKSIKKYSPYKIFSLLLLYPTYYLTYYFSVLRQGLVLCLFICFGINFLIEKKYIRYYILVVILCLFHFSAFLLLLLPFFYRLHKQSIPFLLLVSLMLSIIVGYTGALRIAFQLVGAHTDYLKISISIQGIILRLIVYGLIYYLYSVYKDNCVHDNETIRYLFNFYTIGVVFFLLLSFSSNLSQRITMPIKAIELLLLPMLLYKIRFKQWVDNPKNKNLLVHFVNMSSVVSLVIIAIMNVELVKNIYSYISQGNYFSWVNPFNYPYISIFDKDKIWDYISEFKI